MKKKYFILRAILSALVFISIATSCKKDPEVVGTPITSASFTYVVSNSNLIPCTLTIANTSLNATNYSWSYGIGETSSEINPPAINFTETGTYTITLMAINSNNPDALTNQSVATANIVIGANPTVASFNVSVSHNSFAPCIVTITNTTTYATNYSWSFGNGESLLKDPSDVIYDTPGTYNISLTASNSLNHDPLTNQSVANMQIIVKDPVQWVCYFADRAAGRIKYTVIDASAPIVYDFVMDPLTSIYGMDVDTINNKVYFSDYNTKAIYVANCDGTGFGKIISTNLALDGPYAVKVIGSKIYWSMQNGIYSSDFDGTNETIIDLSVAGFPKMPLDMDYDPASNTLYLVDDKITFGGGVWSIDLTNNTASELITGVEATACEIDVPNAKIYYTLADGLYWSDIDGTNSAPFSNVGTLATYGIADYRVDGNLFWGFRASDSGADGKIIKSALNGSSPIDWITGINPYSICIYKVKL